jgi:hypothetical protein
MDQITRRKFLQIAGGITFLHLTPIGKGLFAAPDGERPLPLFTVSPYIQPGSASLLVDGHDTLAVMWQTQNVPANFELHYGTGKKLSKAAKIIMGERAVGGSVTATALGQLQAPPVSEDTKRLSYIAPLTGLQLSKKYYYRVTGNGQVIAEGYATTRKPRGAAIRFVAFGDNSCDDVEGGDLADRAIAYYAYQANPDFVMNTGDNVYENGLDSQYSRFFFPVYNADKANSKTGAPLLRSVPYYTVIANHDVTGKMHITTGSEVCADFDRNPDSLGYYTAMSLPANGPQQLKSPTPVLCSDDHLLSQFKECAVDRFPTMANYSFDYGDVHFCCLDSNEYVDPTDSALQSWIEKDISSSDAIWKIVVYHHPAFNVGGEHYREQQMRVLSPLLEKLNVNVVLHGHEHTYQRTLPLKFMPSDLSKAADITSKDRRVPGKFVVDRDFDGVTKTEANGIIYITTGAGGKELYDAGYTDAPEKWLHPDDNNEAYVAKFYSALHSLTIFEASGRTIRWTQKNENDEIIDVVKLTKRA